MQVWRARQYCSRVPDQSTYSFIVEHFLRERFIQIPSPTLFKRFVLLLQNRIPLCTKHLGWGRDSEMQILAQRSQKKVCKAKTCFGNGSEIKNVSIGVMWYGCFTRRKVKTLLKNILVFLKIKITSKWKF